ncbi:TonB-dependent receptor [Sphingomonas sp. AOB5]|uniref:TonB-dependent receptor plug domain-containing protein n=1 Tax=Sphingomonas sp. AOB5 TaxID=3034017 RepID=UPI0023F6E137|nr:TonB-dependent receptor [Sphingomonas sp. AOB5]MDF7776967.1 TonB-dependent receptor [Sphingomonas sp. AOB5]
MRKLVRRRLLASTLLLSAAAAAAPAWAQEAAPAEEELVVTGSRIQRPDLETASPVKLISEDEIAMRQPGTVEELLRDLPSVRPALGPGVNNGSNGSATVNLRGVGENRTLVLLDGRRIVPFGLDGVTDTNVIPVALVQRVDVVTGGASSVYGADAVAGVINFITRRDFSGMDLNASYRISGEGDAARYSADLTVGGNFMDDRGNATLSIGYLRADPLLHTQRAISQIPISSQTGLFSGSTAAVPTIFTSPGVTNFGFPSSSIGAVINPTTGAFEAATAVNTFNTNIGTYFQTPIERYNIYATAHYDVTDDIEVYTSGMFTRSKVTLQLASSATFTNTYQLSLNNPYLPVAARNQLCAAYDTNTAVAGIQPISPADCAAAAAVQGGPGTAGYREIPVIAQRRFTEYGPRGNPVESTQFQVVAGIRGNITDSIKFDLYAQYGETNQNQSRENWGSFSKVQQALRAYRNGTGTAVCTDTSNGCVPLNLFGSQGSITSAMLGFIDLDARIQRKTDQTVVSGTISGDLFGAHSPFAVAPIGFAVGFESRDIFSESLPDGPSQIQGEVLGTGARTPPDIGGYSVKEVYGEIIVPLVEDVPGFYRLTAEAGIRYSDYSTTGASTTWKAGGSWEPVQGFKFRGMYQVAVRSPNIQELYQGQVQGLGNLAVDPCAGAAPVGNSALTALCIATGAPSGSIGSITQPSSSQINVTTSGNPNLNVEKASTYTLGGVFTPSFLPRFSLTVDYFNITIKDAISNPAQGDILNGCYSTALNPTLSYNGFCALIGRNPLNGSLNGAGDTPGVILGGSNLGLLKTAGVDVGMNYSLPTDFGKFDFGLNVTWLDYYHFQATPNSINRDCTGYYSTNCTNPRPEWKWNGRMTYSTGALDVSLLWTHISSVKLEPFLATALTPLITPQPGGPNPTTVLDAYEKIKAYDYFDVTVRYDVLDNLQLTLTVDNIFDVAPPLVGANVGGTSFNSGNTFPTVYDPIGRAFTMGVRLKF